ncbi:MAG TPA: thioredoxin domain-containing protein, partial [Herpetosiphonaceae bacterium]
MTHQQNNKPKFTNRLIHETSPYLLHHANNPTAWFAWGEEALQLAKDNDKPIHLSIGYNACHWCHVMSSESFENEETAAYLNEHFINIKVDREERPDIDSLYMAAVQAMTQHGGWPMTVFLTPDGAPFYGGTYFPPEPRYGMPSFRQVLESVAHAYATRRDEINESAAGLREHLRKITMLSLPETALSPQILDNAARSLMRQFDERFGGYGNAPKFPQVMSLEVILRHWRRTGDKTALEQLELTLRRMAEGGIYDQLGGGFARYSVDERWLVPHFEKMLYDNALLSRIYLEAFQATGDPFYRRIAEETLDYVLRDMTDPAGGFYSSEDADSEGEEGKFYVWSAAEIDAALGAEDAALARRYWGVTEAGNFEGHTILNVGRPAAAPASGYPAGEVGMSAEQLWERIVAIRATLLELRSRRIRPARDEKILASWNGLMLRSFALAARVLDRADYRAAAERNAAFLLDNLLVDGRMRRSYKDGAARLNGYLEDDAMVADGLLALYEATFDAAWLRAAAGLADGLLERFWDAEHATFFDTAADHEQLVTRPRDVYDNAMPSGTSVAADVLLRLALLLDRPLYHERAQAVLENLSGAMVQIPGAFGRLLAALDFALAEPREIAVMGDPAAGDARALLAVANRRYLPNALLAGALPDDAAALALVPLLRER